MHRSATWRKSALPDLRILRPLFPLVVVLACNHAEPFHLGPQDSQKPFEPGLPRQITFAGGDISAARAAHGQGWVYSYTLPMSPAIIDRCLAGIPTSGGGQSRTYCDVSTGHTNLATTLYAPVELTDGRLAYVRNRAFPANGPIFEGTLRLGTFALRDSGVQLRKFPYSTPNGLAHGIRTPSPLSAHELIFVSTRVDYLGRTSAVRVESGLQIERLDVNHPSATPDVFPGTALASSVDPTPDGRVFYYTLAGDSHIYRRTIATGATDTIFDFGSLGVARGVRAADSVVYAVVGGRVGQAIVQPDLPPPYEFVQYDSGGTLIRLDLRNGALDSIPVNGFAVSDPVLSEDHHFVLFTAWPTQALWLVEVP